VENALLARAEPADVDRGTLQHRHHRVRASGCEEPRFVDEEFAGFLVRDTRGGVSLAANLSS